ncbi:MAG: hypothetical protein NW226_22120 [Microscillaceae bacterium]|nr:hypothetical protein [Microscillaceae bacterium]
MTSFQIRPYFRQMLSLPLEEVKNRIEDQLNKANCPCKGLVIPGEHTHIILKIPPQERHFWSPHLHLTLEEQETDTLIRGLYGPDPAIWTIFAFAYIFLSTAILFLGMIGFSQWSLNLDSSILWWVPVCGVLLIGLYLLAQLGQKFGAEQTFILHHFYEGAVQEKVRVH